MCAVFHFAFSLDLALSMDKHQYPVFLIIDIRALKPISLPLLESFLHLLSININLLNLLTHLTQGESSFHLRFAPSGGLAAAGY